jgi:hypothetical protein
MVSLADDDCLQYHQYGMQEDHVYTEILKVIVSRPSGWLSSPFVVSLSFVCNANPFHRPFRFLVLLPGVACRCVRSYDWSQF